MKPHDTFSYIRADEVAECWDGVSPELYTALWNIVGDQKPIPNIEDSGPHDHIGYESLSQHWDKLSEDQQVKLNDLAVKNDVETGG